MTEQPDTTKHPFTFKLLDETVADTDQFSSQTHSKLADTLFDLINTSEKGFTIGLEGHWGSGKSTVINLLKKSLETRATEKTLVFLFDAWAHNGDPLRRIFLEELLERASLKKEVNTENSTEEEIKKEQDKQSLLDKIRGYKKSITITSNKSFSALGAVLSLSAFSIPIGTAILSKVDYNNLYILPNSQATELNTLFVAGLSICFLPLLLASILLLFRFVYKKDNTSTLFNDITQDEQEQNITENGERTSIEFENYFKEILPLIVGKSGTYQRILIVVDNLDRVSVDQANIIWSTLQTFFQFRSNGIEDDFSKHARKLWFLVPYDRQGLSNILEGIPSTKDSTKSDFPPESTTHLSNTESFIGKCFQVVIQVPEPVISEWVDHLEVLMDEAFPEWDITYKDEIVSVYKRYQSHIEISPTPRELRSFVNQVGILALRWKNEIANQSLSVESITVYAILQKNYSQRELRKHLLDEEFLSNYLPSVSHAQLRMEIAGILFGVDKDKGFQILIEPDIKQALITSDIKKFSQLAKQHKKAFWVVWRSINGQNLFKERNSEFFISYIVTLLSNVNDYKDHITTEIENIENELLKHEFDFRNDYHKAIQLFVPLANKKALILERAIEQINSKIKGLMPTNSTIEPRTDLFNNIVKVTKEIEKFTPITPLEINSLSHTKIKFWCSYNFHNMLPHVSISPKILDKINNELKSNIQKPGIEALETITLLLENFPKEGNWQSVTASLCTIAKDPHRHLNSEKIYHLLLKLHMSGEEKVENLFNDAQFIEKINQETLGNTPSLIILFLLIKMENLFTPKAPRRINNFFTQPFNENQHGRFLRSVDIENQQHIIQLLAKDERNILIKDAIDKGLWIISTNTNSNHQEESIEKETTESPNE